MYAHLALQQTLDTHAPPKRWQRRGIWGAAYYGEPLSTPRSDAQAPSRHAREACREAHEVSTLLPNGPATARTRGLICVHNDVQVGNASMPKQSNRIPVSLLATKRLLMA